MSEFVFPHLKPPIPLQNDWPHVMNTWHRGRVNRNWSKGIKIFFQERMEWYAVSALSRRRALLAVSLSSDVDTPTHTRTYKIIIINNKTATLSFARLTSLAKAPSWILPRRSSGKQSCKRRARLWQSIWWLFPSLGAKWVVWRRIARSRMVQVVKRCKKDIHLTSQFTASTSSSLHFTCVFQRKTEPAIWDRHISSLPRGGSITLSWRTCCSSWPRGWAYQADTFKPCTLYVEKTQIHKVYIYIRTYISYLICTVYCIYT